MILLPPPGITHLPNPVWMPGLCRHLREVSSSGQAGARRRGPVLGSAVGPPGHLTLGHQPTQNRFRRAGHVTPPWPLIGRLPGCGALIGGAATPASPARLVSPGLSRWRDLLLSVQVSTVMSSVSTGSSWL